MLSEPQKAAVRRHMGVPMLGIQNIFYAFDYFYNPEEGNLEQRMNMLSAVEQAFIVGNSIGVFQVVGTPIAGQQLFFTLPTGSNFTYTVTAADVAFTGQGGALYSVTQNAAAAISSAMAAGGLYTAVPQLPYGYGTAQLFVPPAFGQIIISGPGGTLFTIAASGSGALQASVAQQGLVCPVNAYIGTSKTQYFGYVPICDALESLLTQADLSLTYEVADVVTFRRDEVRARNQLYSTYRQRLADMFGVKLYPMGRPGFGGGFVV